MAPVTGMVRPYDDDIDPWHRTRIGLGAMAGLLTVGTLTYRALGLGWIDAYYQTVITVSTVGYSEIGDEIDNTYRLVTSFIVLFGVGITLYTIGVTFDAVMEGRLRQRFGRNRMQRELDELADHIVVCGWGQVGQAITSSIRDHGEVVVVVDRERRLAGDIGGLLVTGEATNDDVLRRAGLERARGLVVALDSDADNLWVTLSGRSLNPELFIVARSNGSGAGPKLLQAGADRVVNPHEIGGTRMASLIVQPNVADFVAESMTDRMFEIQLGECAVADCAHLQDRTLDQSGLIEATGVTVLALRRPDGSFVHHPAGDQVLTDGDVLIALGTPSEHETLRLWSAGRAPSTG